MTPLDPAAADAPGCLRTFAIFVLVASPVYMLLRVVARVARQAYGFDPGPDEPPPLVCAACHNTILETGWLHCPYCGAALPSAASAAPAPADAARPDAPDDDGADGADVVRAV